MVGSALLTIVLDSIATNIARRRPLRASSTSRWVISPLCSAVMGGAWVTAVLRSVAISNSCSPQPYGGEVCSAIRRRRDVSHPAHGRRARARTCSDPQACCPSGGAPGDDTGSLRVGWLQWIRRQLSADRAALAGSHLTHPKRTHSSDHLPSVCPNRTSARDCAQ